MGRRVDIPADGDIEHLGAQLVNAANDDEASQGGLSVEEMEKGETRGRVQGDCAHGETAP